MISLFYFEIIVFLDSLSDFYTVGIISVTFPVTLTQKDWRTGSRLNIISKSPCEGALWEFSAVLEISGLLTSAASISKLASAAGVL